LVQVGVDSHRPSRGHVSLGPRTLGVVLRRSWERVLGVGLFLLRVGGEHGGGATACHHGRLGARGYGSRGSP